MSIPIEKTSTQKKQSEENNDINLIELLLKLWSYRKIIIYIILSFFILSIVYSLLAKKWYESEVTLFKVNSSKAASAGLSSLAAQFGLGAILGNMQEYTLDGIIYSKRVCNEIIKKKWQTEKSEDSLNLIEYFEVKGDTYHEQEEFAYEKFINLVAIETDDKTLVVTITVRMPEPKLAADIANYFPELLSKYVQSEQHSNLKENIQYINTRLSDVKIELANAEDNLTDFRQLNRIITQSPELQLEYARLQREVTIKQEVYLTLIQQYELAQIELIKETPVISVIDEAVPPVRRFKPKRTLIVILSTFVGGIFAIIGVLGYESFGVIKENYFKKPEKLSTIET